VTLPAAPAAAAAPVRTSLKTGRLLRCARARICVRSSDVLAVVVAWPASRFVASWPLLPSWLAGRAGRVHRRRLGRRSLRARPAVRVVARVRVPGLARRLPLRERRARDRRTRRERHERGQRREEDRPDPADPAHRAPSRPFVDRPRVRVQIAGGGVRESCRSTWLWVCRPMITARAGATVTGGTDELGRRPSAAGQRRHAL
jgi:hypothetical protein